MVEKEKHSKEQSCTKLFCEHLKLLLLELEQLKLPNIVLGDFIDDFRVPGEVQLMFRTFGYKQIVDTHTTEAGTVLDLVYT